MLAEITGYDAVVAAKCRKQGDLLAFLQYGRTTEARGFGTERVPYPSSAHGTNAPAQSWPAWR